MEHHLERKFNISVNSMRSEGERDLSPIRMRQKYTRVNILRCANFTRGK